MQKLRKITGSLIFPLIFEIFSETPTFLYALSDKYCYMIPITKNTETYSCLYSIYSIAIKLATKVKQGDVELFRKFSRKLKG